MSENELKVTENNVDSSSLEEKRFRRKQWLKIQYISEEKAASEDKAPAEEQEDLLKGFLPKKILEEGSKRGKYSVREVFDWLRTICIGVLAGVFIVVFLVQRDDVYGSSMMPTLSSGDVVYTQKISTYFNTYKRGDIVVLDGSDMEGYTKKEYLIKRIVGLPGET